VLLFAVAHCKENSQWTAEMDLRRQGILRGEMKYYIWNHNTAVMQRDRLTWRSCNQLRRSSQNY